MMNDPLSKKLETQTLLTKRITLKSENISLHFLVNEAQYVLNKLKKQLQEI